MVHFDVMAAWVQLLDYRRSSRSRLRPANEKSRLALSRQITILASPTACLLEQCDMLSSRESDEILVQEASLTD